MSIDGATPPAGETGPALRPVSVTLRVPDLDGSLEFYRDALGLVAAEAPAGGDGAPRVALSPAGGGSPVVRLEEAPEAPAPPRRAAGLFHLALRVPGRRHLARVLAALPEKGVRLQGASDHLVSEALYMSDPHGNGVEIYADRPRSEWTWEGGEVRMATEPLDVKGLLEELDGGSSRDSGDGTPLLPRGTDLGHVHLKVTDLDRAEAFYSGVLGLPVTTRSYPGALFFGAGGYHHHVGANVWTKAGGDPRQEDALGLVEVTFGIADPAVLEEVRGRAREGGFSAPADDDPAPALEDADGIRIRLGPRG